MHYALCLPNGGPDAQTLVKFAVLAEEAGMTWWCEYVPPDEPDYMRKSIEQGPLRID